MLSFVPPNSGCWRPGPRCRPSPNFNYALKRWTALTRYRDDGAVAIDNNAAERELRGPVLSHKNFLFAGANGF